MTGRRRILETFSDRCPFRDDHGTNSGRDQGQVGRFIVTHDGHITGSEPGERDMESIDHYCHLAIQVIVGTMHDFCLENSGKGGSTDGTDPEGLACMGGDICPCQAVFTHQPKEPAIIINDRNIPDIMLIHQGCNIYRCHVMRCLLRVQKGNIPNHRFHTLNQNRGGNPCLLEDEPGLIIHIPASSCNIGALPHHSQEMGIRDRTRDTVGVRLPVAKNIYRLHTVPE